MTPNFLERQVLTSRNIRGGRFMDSFMGPTINSYRRRD